MLDVNVAQRGEGLCFAFMSRIEPSEKLAKLLERFDVEVNFPRSQVISQERVDRRSDFDPRLQGGAGEREATALRGASHTHARCINFGAIHHDSRQLHTVEEDLSVQQLARTIEQATNDVSVKG